MFVLTILSLSHKHTDTLLLLNLHPSIPGKLGDFLFQRALSCGN